MENDLISRSALLSELQSYKEDLSLVFESLEQGAEKRICSAEICGVLDAIIQVHNAPAVDAVEVTHCRECKHWIDGFAGCTEHIKACEYGGYMVGGNGYCVYGEREADDGK